MEKEMRIRMLGEFSIAYGEEKIDGQETRSTKLWSMLAYLIAFREREVSQSELIELLWPDGMVENPANTLKTLLHRVRSVLSTLGIPGNELLYYRRGVYRWCPTIPQTVDAEEFETLCQTACSQRMPAPERLSAALAAAELYEGMFLPGQEMHAWVIPAQAYYQGQYLRVIHYGAEQLEQKKAYAKMVSLCRQGVQNMPYEESIHAALIRALLGSGRLQEAKIQYETIAQLLFHMFGVNPSKELAELVPRLNGEEAEQTFPAIFADLAEKAAEKPFFCSYETLKSVYRLLVRGALRTGQTGCLCLLTLTDRKQKNQNQDRSGMERLQNVLEDTLWKGDLYARCSASQMLLLLPSASVEQGEAVLRRISDAFYDREAVKQLVLRQELRSALPEWYGGWERRNS